ncbi:UNVERIFIED_ORG: hypothetical protein J2791_002989 [Burkholderia contaminans]|nr:hypothetical protein [Burkholderia contaminans]
MKTENITPFIDSTSLVCDTVALRAVLREKGYLLIRGILDHKSVDHTRRAIEAVVERSGWLLPGTSASERRPDMRHACVEPQPEFRRVYDKVFALEAFHTLSHCPSLTALIGGLLDTPEPLVHPRKIGRLIFPAPSEGMGFSTPAHQDYWAIQGAPDTLTVWMPLHDCSFEQGSLMIAEGTHRDGMFPYRLALGAGAVEVSDPLDGRWRGGDLHAGDILIFYTMTVHKAAPNRTNRMRFSIDSRYQRPLDPITEPCLNLDGMGYDWRDVYAEWESRELQYYWKKWSLRVKPYSTKYYARRDELAFEEGRNGNPIAISSLQRISQYHPNPSVRDEAGRILKSLESINYE